MTAGVALEVAGTHLGAREGPVPREASARRAHPVRPPQPEDPRTLARVRPLGGPPDLPCSGGSRRPAGHCPPGPVRRPARQGPRGPLGTGAFFWPPGYSFDAAGPFGRLSHTRSRCPRTRSWQWPSRTGPPWFPLAAGGGGARCSHLSPAGGGEAGGAQRLPRLVSTSPDPPTAGAAPRAVQKYGDLLTDAPPSPPLINSWRLP